MLSFFKHTSIRSFLPISAFRERLLSLITSLKQAWVQHLLALMIATLLSCSLVCTWALQVHSLSADRANASFIIWEETAFRQQGQSVSPFDVASLLRQTWGERA